MTELSVTIIITNHNYEAFVGAAISSALSQTARSVQVIVVDDGSTDGSLDVIRRFDEIEVIAQPNGGQASAFNAGFERATGQIVFFLDADDELAPDVVARVRDAMVDEAVVRVQFRLGVIDASGEALPGEIPPAGKPLASGDVRRELVSFPDDIVWQPTSGNAFRQTVLDQILPMPTEPYRICADYYLSNLTPANGEVVALAGPGGSYRIHGANGDYEESVSVAKVRANIVRTSITHRHLIAECRRVGLEGLPSDPDDVRSVTALAMRMISIRLEPAEHPIESDTRRGLVGAGVRASTGRFDKPRTRRFAMAGWFLVMAVLPARFVSRCARPFVCITPSSSS